MKIKARKICVNNKLTKCIQIVDLFVYNKLSTDNLQRIITEIRTQKRAKPFIYLYSYKYRTRKGPCGVITDECYTKSGYEKRLEELKQQHKQVRVFTVNGELLI